MAATTLAFIVGNFSGVFVGLWLLGVWIIFRDRKKMNTGFQIDEGRRIRQIMMLANRAEKIRQEHKMGLPTLPRRVRVIKRQVAMIGAAVGAWLVTSLVLYGAARLVL